MSLHWLKVNERITYKIAMLVYKCMNGSAPEYLAKLEEKPSQGPMFHIQKEVTSHLSQNITCV